MTEQIEKTLKMYELAFLIKEEEQAPAVEALVKARGGEIKSAAPLKRTALAYKIKKESSAFFGVLNIEMEPENAKALEHDLQMSPVVLRSLIVVPDSVETGKKKQTGSRASAGSDAPRKKEDTELSNEVLQKQIEELAAKN